MPPRYRLPTLWLMTDSRLGDLLAAVRRLPPGSGIVFRHLELRARERRALFEQVRALARRRRLKLLLEGNSAVARAWRADGAHSASHRPSRGLRSYPVHNVREAVQAARLGAQLAFVSPVFPTRTHPGAPSLGPVRLGLLLRHVDMPAIALGGMTRHTYRRLRGLDLVGWAAIDAFADAPRT